MSKRYQGRAQRIDNLQMIAAKADEKLQALVEAGAPADEIAEARRKAERAQRELEWSLR